MWIHFSHLLLLHNDDDHDWSYNSNFLHNDAEDDHMSILSVCRNPSSCNLFINFGFVFFLNIWCSLRRPGHFANAVRLGAPLFFPCQNFIFVL